MGRGITRSTVSLPDGYDKSTDKDAGEREKMINLSNNGNAIASLVGRSWLTSHPWTAPAAPTAPAATTNPVNPQPIANPVNPVNPFMQLGPKDSSKRTEDTGAAPTLGGATTNPLTKPTAPAIDTDANPFLKLSPFGRTKFAGGRTTN